ncbi:MAG: MBL fold metallo-hydrolase [Candidatus Pacebacteria bacterium]|nr:MBL fold metallo-hydrolase [Candidatus Paceibacterota bacterium]
MIGLTVLGSGSRGNGIVVQSDDASILIDAGFSSREIQRRMCTVGLENLKLDAVLVSHEHSDHVKGLRVLAKQLDLPVFCNRGTGEVIKDRGLSPDQLSLFSAGASFTIRDMTIEPFSIPHDAMDPMGFIIRTPTHKVGIVTDLGHVSRMACHHLRECDILVLESNHDLDMLRQSTRPWSLKQRIISRHGHLSNDDSMALLQQILHPRTKHVVLAHASQDCNRYDLVRKCVTANLTSWQRPDVQAYVATQDTPLPTILAQ